MRIAIIHENWGAGAARCARDLEEHLGKRHEVLFFPRTESPETQVSVLEGLRAFRPDVVNCHSFYGGLPYGILAELSSRYPVCFTVHDPRPIGTMETKCWDCDRNSYCLRCPLVPGRWRKILWNRFFTERLRKRLCHLRCGKDMHVVAPSQWMADHLRIQELRRFQIHTIPNGVDLDHFKPQQANRARLELPEDAMVLLHLAWHHGPRRINDRKGLPILAEAFVKHVAPRFKNAILAVAGESFAPNHPQVRPLGMVPHMDLPALYSAMDVFVQPTLADNFPYTVSEAMACGKAVVASRVGGVPEQITDGINGRLVEAGNPDELGKTLIGLLEQPDMIRAYGIEGRKRAEESLGMEKFIAAYDELFAKLRRR